VQVSVLAAAVLAMSTGVATAAQSAPVESDADIASFGLLGPVGLIAVALGVIGMALGAVRQRRKSQAAAEIAEVVAGEPVEPLPVEDPAYIPYRRSA
jgi:hypothetical protein